MDLNRLFWTGLGAFTTYSLVDAGLSHCLALETVRHGTGPIGYVGINLFGGMPSLGGSSLGSSAGLAEAYRKDSENYFHVFKPYSCTPTRLTNMLLWKIIIGTLRGVCTRRHATGSGMAYHGPSAEGGLWSHIQRIPGAIAGFMTPTLKFRFTAQEIGAPAFNFEEDPDYYPMAFRTKTPISVPKNV